MCLDNLVINSYIDNVLNEHETMLVKEHLESCQKCRSLFNSYKTLVTAIGHLPEPQVSFSFLDELLLKIKTDTHPSSEELSFYYDQSINKTIIPELKEHLESCALCQQKLDNLKVISLSITALDNYQTSPDFFANLAVKIDTLDEAGSKNNSEIFQAAPDFFDGLMLRIEGLSEDIGTTEEINCISSEDLSIYLDNEPTNISVSDIESHLESCSKCKSKYSSFKISRESVLYLQQPDVPFNFSRKVLEDINRQEKKIIKLLPFIRRSGHKVSMVAGIIITGILVTMSRSVIQQPEQTQTAVITVKSEDLLFLPDTSSYRTDSFEVLADNSRDDSLEIQDIGL